MIIKSTDFVRQSSALPTVESFKSTNTKNPKSRIIRSSWNQANHHPFGSQYAGKQCTAMCLSAIVKVALGVKGAAWTIDTINNVLLKGHELYKQIIHHSDEEGIVLPESGYLLVKNFDVIKTAFAIFESIVSVNYDQDPAIFGNIAIQTVDYLPNLRNGLLKFFEEHMHGIIISGSKAFAVMLDDDKYYFFDSHGCGSAGAPAQNGKSCFIECENL